jgi:hypothetical protein
MENNKLEKCVMIIAFALSTGKDILYRDLLSRGFTLPVITKAMELVPDAVRSSSKEGYCIITHKCNKTRFTRSYHEQTLLGNLAK